MLRQLVEKWGIEKTIWVFGFLGVFIIVMAGYLYTIAPTVSFWDCGEFIACSYTLGVPHPPGTPLAVLLGRMFSLIPVSSEIAFRINLMSAISGALSCAFIFLIVVKILMSASKPKGIVDYMIIVVSGLGASLIAAFSFSVWDNCVETEVYAPSSAIMFFLVWLTLVWRENLDKPGNKNLLLLMFYIICLSIGLHLMPLLVAPGILIFVLLVRPKDLVDRDMVLIAIGLGFIAITTYLYLIIRAHHDPGINESDPRTFSVLWDVFTRKQYGPMSYFPRKTAIETGIGNLLGFWHQIRMYINYFAWQFAKFPREVDVSAMDRVISVIITLMFNALGIFGMWVHYKTDKKAFWLLFITYILTSFGLVFYLNLKYSPSDPNPLHQPREVRERDYFFAVSFMFFAYFVGYAFYYILKWVRSTEYRGFIRTVVCAVLVLLISVLPFAQNLHSHVNRRDNWIAHDYAQNMLLSCKDYSVLFTNGDNDTFPLWFAQEVKGTMKFDPEEKKGVMIANLSLLNTDWYLKQLVRRGVVLDFDKPFRRSKWEDAYIASKRRGYKGEFYEFVIEHLMPTRIDDGSVLLVRDIAIRAIIASNSGVENYTYKDLFAPIDKFKEKFLPNFKGVMNVYFAGTVDPAVKKEYQDHLLMEGLVYRVVPDSGEMMVDIPRSESLLTKVYSFRGIFDDRVYKDDNTYRLVANYGAAFFYVGVAYEREAGVSVFDVFDRDVGELSDSQRESLQKAVWFFKEGLKFSTPEKVPFVLHLSACYLCLGDVEKGIEILKESFEKTENYVFGLLLGQVYRRLRLYDDALRYYQRIVKLKPDEGSAYAGMLDIYYKRGEWDKIRELVDFAVSRDRIFAKVVTYFYFQRNRSLTDTLISRWLKTHPGDPTAESLLVEVRKGTWR